METSDSQHNRQPINPTPTNQMQTEPTNNPYQSPSAQLDTAQLVAVSPNTQTWYHLSGRIGRLRYLAYVMMMTIIGYLFVGVLMAILVPFVSDGTGSNDGFGILLGLVYLLLLPFLFYTSIIYPKRRLHDLGKSGWLLLLLFVPIVNVIFGFYLMLAKGDVGVNEYGNPPRENKAIHYIGALVVPIGLSFLIGILAAIALPAYQDYAQRSQEAMLEVE